MAVVRFTVILSGFVLLFLSAMLTAARRPNPQAPFTIGTVSGPEGIYVYLQRRDNGEWIQVTPGGAEYRSPAWSPDGRWIAYINYSLHRIRPNGRDLERLTRTLDGAPSWSPDSS